MTPNTNYFQLRICIIIRKSSRTNPKSFSRNIRFWNFRNITNQTFEKRDVSNNPRNRANNSVKMLNTGSIFSKNKNWAFGNATFEELEHLEFNFYFHLTESHPQFRFAVCISSPLWGHEWSGLCEPNLPNDLQPGAIRS